MKSNICSLETDGLGREAAMLELDKMAKAADLDEKSSLRLQLLGEEVISLMNSIAGKISAEFWIEEENKSFQIHLMTRDYLDYDSRKQMKTVSSTGKNAEAKGILGKIRVAFEACMNGYMEPVPGKTCGMEGYMPMTGSSMMYEGLESGSMMMWSLNTYTEQIDEQDQKEEWDELEKSIIAKLADDVTVGIRNKKAEIVITKAF